MWLMRRRRASRIFQDQTLQAIVSTVLSRWTFPVAAALARISGAGYCVQYQETDYAFVTRLLAEEGIFFFFEPRTLAAPSPPRSPSRPTPRAPSARTETIVFGDAPGAYPFLAKARRASRSAPTTG